jgi:hypothetical protein
LQRQATRRVAVPLVRPLSDSRRLLRPLLTSRSGSAPLPFQARGEISPGKDAILHRTTVAFTPSALGHESFADACLLALPDDASDALRVPRLTVYAPRFLPTLGHPHAVALHLPRCGQLGRGLAPRRSRPCWAHKQKGSSEDEPLKGSARGRSAELDPARPGSDQKLCTTPRLNALLPVPVSVALLTVNVAPLRFWMRANAE